MVVSCFFFFQAEDGIRDLVRSRGLGDVYKRQHTIGAPYWRTVVGEFENSESPYGTFDQSGNVNELSLIHI